MEIAVVFTHLNSALVARIGNAVGKFPTSQISQVFPWFSSIF